MIMYACYDISKVIRREKILILLFSFDGPFRMQVSGMYWSYGPQLDIICLIDCLLTVLNTPTYSVCIPVMDPKSQGLQSSRIFLERTVPCTVGEKR